MIAINQVAARGLQIAENETAVKQIIIAGQKGGRALTIAAIQPTVLQDNKNGKISCSPVGQIIITSNWQYVDGKLYSNPANFNMLDNKTSESHQHIWNVFVDLDKGTVTSITEPEPERIMKETLKPNFLFAGMNMFMADTVKVKSGSWLTWFNNSNLPHNIVGIYKKSGSGIKIPVDSGIIQPNESWRRKIQPLIEYLRRKILDQKRP